jgi:hypothetical protein
MPAHVTFLNTGPGDSVGCRGDPADTGVTMLDVILSAVLTSFTALALVRSWHWSVAQTIASRPPWWPQSERVWLGIAAGQALIPIWFGTGGVMVIATGTISDVAFVAFTVTTLLGASLFLLGFPSFLMPPAFRGSFRGWLRDSRPAVERH